MPLSAGSPRYCRNRSLFIKRSGFNAAFGYDIQYIPFQKKANGSMVTLSHPQPLSNHYIRVQTKTANAVSPVGGSHHLRIRPSIQGECDYCPLTMLVSCPVGAGNSANGLDPASSGLGNAGLYCPSITSPVDSISSESSTLTSGSSGVK